MSEAALISKKIEQAIKADIIHGKLNAGQKISISQLKEIWGTSSTPVRDAIKSLESKGFLIISPRESIMVATMDRQMFKDVFEVRIALECMALEIATPIVPLSVLDSAIEKHRTANRMFSETKDIQYLYEIDFLAHEIILEHCRNKRLVQMVQESSDLTAWVRTIVVNKPHGMEFALPEHLQILGVMRRRNIADAQEAMRLHLRNVYRRTLDAL